MKWELALIALAVLVVAAVSRRLVDSALTPPMMFVLIGLLVGPLVIDQVTLAPTGATVRTLAEATLAVLLFADAARINLSALRREYSVPLRLLGLGLPLTIALGAVLAVVVFGHLTITEAIVLAVLLAPTDAALGQAVVTEPRLPSRVRQGLNVESGLNDGICVPLLLIALAVSDVESKLASSHRAFTIVIDEIGYGILGGVAAGLFAVAVVKIAYPRNLIAGSWLQVIPVAGAGLAYGLATALGGSGFISAFLAGAVFGSLASNELEEAYRLSEEIGELLCGVTFLVFGAVLLGPALEQLSWRVALYAVLSLTLARMLPVAIAMVGSGARWQTIGFLGWFGPRGLATIVFAVIVVQEAHLPGAGTILLATYITVGLSIFAHGISAAPLASRYANWYASHDRNRRPVMESVPAPTHRSRRTLDTATVSVSQRAERAEAPAQASAGVRLRDQPR